MPQWLGCVLSVVGVHHWLVQDARLWQRLHQLGAVLKLYPFYAHTNISTYCTSVFSSVNVPNSTRFSDVALTFGPLLNSHTIFFSYRGTTFSSPAWDLYHTTGRGSRPLMAECLADRPSSWYTVRSAIGILMLSVCPPVTVYDRTSER